MRNEAGMTNEHDINDMKDYQDKAWGYAMDTAKNPGYLFTGLAGEAGEVCSLAAKQWRDSARSKEEFMKDLSKELGDTLWFVAGLATQYGISLADIAKDNLTKLQDRAERNAIQGSGDNR